MSLTHCDYAEVVGECFSRKLTPHVLCSHTTGSCTEEQKWISKITYALAGLTEK